MKRFILLILMLYSLLTVGAVEVVGPGMITSVVTQQHAFDATVKYLGDSERKYSYYVVENNDSTYWNIFVDTRLGTGWERKCYLSLVERYTMSNVNNMLPNQVTECSVPPSETLTPLQFTIQWVPPGMDSKPQVAYGFPEEDELKAAARTYAIILNGGINKNANHERNWNDCSFAYQTLVKKLRVPKENISVVMADGTDPADDMLTFSNTYTSSSLDLDFDGQPDIQYSATAENIKSVFSQLATKMTTDDHLLFFVAGAGGWTNKEASYHYIRLWGEDKLTDFMLDGLFGTLLSKGVTVNAVFGQSYGGGLLTKLSAPGTVITSATDEDGHPSVFSDSPYSEFLYWWTTAINQADASGAAVESDLNGDGMVSMEEASTFAKAKITSTQYASKPAYLGAELSFGNLAESTNLYIKDDYADNGAEPNVSSVFWDSPSIWVRNNDDDGLEHETVSYSENNGTAYVYVKIHNRGKDVVSGTGRCVKLYWAQASTAIADRTWKGQEMYGGQPTGGYIGTGEIGEIASGDSAIVKVKWTIPPYFKYSKDNFQYCIAAILDSKGINIAAANEDPNIMVMPVANRAHALKSVSVVAPSNFLSGEKAYVRNISRLNKTYSLSLVPRTNHDATVFISANQIYLEMDAVLYEAWKRGGKKYTGAYEVTSSTGSPSRLLFNNKNNRIYGLELEGRDLSAVTLKANLVSVPAKLNQVILDLVQRDNDGNIVGSVAFVFRKATQSTTSNEYDLVAVNSESDGDNLEVGGIKSTSTSVAGDRLTVELLTPASEGSVLMISSVLDGGVCSTAKLIPGDTTAEINVATLKPGIYAVAYSVDGITVDTAKFSKK